jgi:hypothetical protein
VAEGAVSVLPFERAWTYEEWWQENPETSEPPRVDVWCPFCEAVMRVVDDDAERGHWYLACPRCGWDEFK